MNLNSIISSQDIKIQALQSENNTLLKRCEHYMQAYDQLQHQLTELIRNCFDKRSERFVDPGYQQLSLFGDDAKFSAADASGNAISDADIQIPAHRRKKHKKIEKELPRRIEIIPLDESDKRCTCGTDKEVIRYETKELLHQQSAVFEMIEQRREVAVCPKGCNGSMITAPAPLHILPKIKATEEFLSFLVVSKLDDRQPLYHLEKQLSERHGLDCSRQTMARWVIDLSVPLQPIYNLLKDAVIEYDVASYDATTLQVLKEPGRAPETKSYVYCMRGGPPNQSVILYDYNDKLHKQFVHTWCACYYL